MLDDLKHYTKYAGLWLTTRGVVSLAILTATVGLGMSGYFAPLIALPIGLATATYLHSDRANYLKTRVKNAYKLEIAATLGIDPKAVTLEDMLRVAEGDKEAGVTANPVLQEQLQRIDKHKFLSDITSATAIGIAMVSFLAILGGGFEHILEGWKGLLEPLASNLPVSNQAVFAAGTLASGISFASDYAIHKAGMGIMGLNERTTYDMVQNLKRLRRVGKTITPEQVLEVFVSRDPALAKAIQDTFEAPYGALTQEQRISVLAVYDKKHLITNMVAKINAGRLSPNELSFVAAGQHSGVVERDPNQHRHIHLFLPNIASPGITPVQPEPATTTITITHKPEGLKAEQPHQGESITHPTEGSKATTSFVERYTSFVSGNRDSGMSHVERLLKENELAQSIASERSV